MCAFGSVYWHDPGGGKAGDAPEEDEDEYEVHAEVVARVVSAYRFNGLADFQFTAHGSFKQRARLKEQKERRWRSEVDLQSEGVDLRSEGVNLRSEDESVSGFGTTADDGEEPLLILPPLFSKNDLPKHYGFKTLSKPREAQDDGKGRFRT
jgi:hypothetical protein